MKEYLQKLWRLNEFIESNKRQLLELRRISESIGGSNFEERVKGGTLENHLETTIAKIVDLEAEIREELDAYITLKGEILSAISRHSDEDESLLLKLRYVEFMTWEQIAEKMNYSTRQIYRLHKDALNNFKLQ